MGISGESYGCEYKVAADHEKIIFAETQRLRIYVYNAEGKKVFEIFDPGKKRTDFTQKERDKIGEQFPAIKKRDRAIYNKFLKHFRGMKNVISDVRLAPGKIVVFLVKEDISVDGGYPVVVYDLKGNVVKKGTMAKIPLQFWRDYAYFVDNDTEDNPQIIKYRVKGLFQ